MKRVLLTGATGFVGRHCLPALVGRGYEVHAISSRLSLRGRSAVHWHRADLFDEARVLHLLGDIRPSHLLHLAWITDPKQFWTSPENLHWVEASVRLLRMFCEQGGERVVMAGTCAEYDWNYGFCRETFTPLSPATFYGSCKHALHLLLAGFARESRLSAAWGRLFFLYGPGSHPARLPAAVICSLLNEQVAHCSHGEQIRDFLHVSDAADALVALLDSDVQGPVNIASGRPLRLREMIDTIAETIGRPHLIRLGALPTPDNEPPVLIADVRRLSQEVRWSPQYDLQRGLTNTIQWWKRNQQRHAS